MNIIGFNFMKTSESWNGEELAAGTPVPKRKMVRPITWSWMKRWTAWDDGLCLCHSAEAHIGSLLCLSLCYSFATDISEMVILHSASNRPFFASFSSFLSQLETYNGHSLPGLAVKPQSRLTIDGMLSCVQVEGKCYGPAAADFHGSPGWGTCNITDTSFLPMKINTATLEE